MRGRKLAPLATCAVAFVAIAPLSRAQTAVETWTATQTFVVSMPGTPDGGGGIDFTGTQPVNTLAFTPGSVTFAGVPVDFSGTEASFLATNYAGTANIPVTSGPGVAGATIDWVSSGAVNSNWTSDLSGVTLGPAFSASNLDVVVGSSFDFANNTPNWSSGVVPQLNGAIVDVDGTNQVTSVDPINGIVNVSGNGTIFATAPVETWTATQTFVVSMPGTPDGGGGIDFTGTQPVNTLAFTPGSVTFAGQPVDFSGTEASFLATNYAGTANIPVTAGPGVAGATINWSSSGAVNSTWTSNLSGVTLGPSFSASNLDVVVGSSFGFANNTPLWSSGVVPELNGATVDVNGTNQVTSVDPINGIVNVSGNGAIFATPAPAVPTLPEWGLILLGVGILGFGALLLLRRPRGATAAA